MGSVKNVAIAFAITLFIICFFSDNNLMEETIEVLNHKIGKSNIKIYNIFIVLLSTIIILCSILNCFSIFYNIKNMIGRNL